jgi:hypothetical protein
MANFSVLISFTVEARDEDAAFDKVRGNFYLVDYSEDLRSSVKFEIEDVAEVDEVNQ